MATIFVDANAASGGNGTAGAPFQTIQDAVNAAANGDTIEVAAGTYREQVTVSGLDDLTINGQGDSTVIEMVDAPATTSSRGL